MTLANEDSFSKFFHQLIFKTILYVHCVSKKLNFCFCHNFVKFPLTLTRNTCCRTRSLSNATFLSFIAWRSSVQNLLLCTKFNEIRWFFAEIWQYNDFQNGGRPPAWNCYTTIRDHPRSLCCWPQLPVKFHVSLIHRSEDIAIWIFRI